MGIVPGQENFWGRWSGWQVLFFVGVLPVVLVVPIIADLEGAGTWKKAKAEAAKAARQEGRTHVGPVPPSALAQEHAHRHLPRRGGHGGLVGHRVLLAGADHDGVQEPALAGARRSSNRRRFCAALETPANSGRGAHQGATLARRADNWRIRSKPAQAVPAATQEALLTDLNRLIQDDEPLRCRGVQVGDSEERHAEPGAVGRSQEARSRTSSS